jgi:GTP cyclohydrolase I
MRNLPDIQKSTEGFPHLFIEKVGVENIKIQIPIRMKSNDIQFVMANIKSYCSLVGDIKGINMSRIGQTVYNVIEDRDEKEGFSCVEEFAYELLKAHDSESVEIIAEFDYILKQSTPITKLYSPRTVNVQMVSKHIDGEMHNYLTIKAIEMSLCPCSKEMSLLKNNLSEKELEELSRLSYEVREKVLLAGYGAHNQKSEITATVEISPGEHFYIEDLASIIASCASAPTFSILKRPDEKWVTEVAYLGGYWDDGNFIETGGGPKFVEDIVRALGETLNSILDDKITDYLLNIRNYESIHSDNIVAASIMSAGRSLK